MKVWSKEVSNIIKAFLLGVMHVSCAGSTHSATEKDDKDYVFETGIGLSESEAKCNELSQSGCVRGQIAHATNFNVSGKKFFDAEELSEYFSEALVVKNESGEDLNKDQYSVRIIDDITNQDFANRFHVALAGETRLGDTMATGTSGDFLISRLPAGVYLTRIFKRFDIEVEFSGGKVAPYCVTIFQEEQLDVTVSGITSMIFDDFQLRYFNRPCTSITNSSISAPPSSKREEPQPADRVVKEPLTLSLTEGLYEKIVGIKDIKSATSKGETLYILHNNGGNKLSVLTEKGVDTYALTSLSSTAVTLVSYSTYTFAHTTSDDPNLYLVDVASREIVTINQNLKAESRLAFDCRSNLGTLTPIHTLFRIGESWNLIDGYSRETCSMSTGHLLSNESLNTSLLGKIGYNGTYYSGFSAYSSKVLKLYDSGLNEVLSYTFTNFPFNTDVHFVNGLHSQWILGCRDSSCYRAKVLIGEK